MKRWHWKVILIGEGLFYRKGMRAREEEEREMCEKGDEKIK